jgi:hypothetical protein
MSMGTSGGGNNSEVVRMWLLGGFRVSVGTRAARLKRSTSLWHDSRLDTTGQEQESFRPHARSQTTTNHAHPYSTRDPTAS